MKMFSLLSLLVIVPTVAFGAGRGDAVVSGGVSRSLQLKGKPISLATNPSAHGTKVEQGLFVNFELDAATKKQIIDVVSKQVVGKGDKLGKIELSDEDKTKIGELVSSQIVDTKGVGNFRLSDKDKKQVGEIISSQLVSGVGGIKLELGDLARKEIGDLFLKGDPCPGCFSLNPGDGVSSSEISQAGGDSNCRDAYRECMDNFCLLDENQGERCACSDNINRAKNKLQEVLDIQAEADKLFSEDVEREQLGAKARLVFTEDTAGNSKVSGKTFMAWLNGSDDEDGEVGEDTEMGDELYFIAAKYCASELESCGSKAEMEEMLYTRMIAQDCKSYDAYLKDQKANAETNKRIAESAVRKARLEMLDTTNKYNRGECLSVYRSCIADKGGCGANFENCLDENLLKRRSNACENILDQCMAVRDYVKQDWAEESKSVLVEAAKYAEENKLATCSARVQNCLEERCSISTNTECLTNVDVAVGFCPVITECDAKVPGFRSTVKDKLAYLRTKFCENDIDKCLQDKCGIDFSKPECVGKQPYEIAQLCPQTMFPACKNTEHFSTIVQSAILQMDYQMLQGCVNYFGEKLTTMCGTDMACLPIVTAATAFDSVPKDEQERNDLVARIVSESDATVDEFFKQLEQDKTVSACVDSQSVTNKKIKGKSSLADSVFGAAKWVAKNSAENRNLREMDSRIAELSKAEDVEEARKNCLTTYKAEKPNESKSNYMYIKSVSFEPSLRNCHVCRMQQVCEEGGESKASAALKGAGGGLAAGAGVGTMANAGIGTAIGAAVGAVGGALGGFFSGGKKKFCQEVESCKDINM